MNNKLAQKVDTKKVFFALAALWASLAPMLFVLSLFAFINLNFTLVEHGRGMLFGLTSALITGYLAGKRQINRSGLVRGIMVFYSGIRNIFNAARLAFMAVCYLWRSYCFYCCAKVFCGQKNS